MKIQHNAFLVPLFLSLTAVFLGQAPNGQVTKSTTSEMPASSSIDCNGTAKACNKPVKFLTKTASCVCFTCGYGTSDAKQLCTKTSGEAKSFAKLARQSGFGEDEMDKAVAAIGAQRKQTSKPDDARQVYTPPQKGPGL
jgi:hypothetical protein